MLQERGLILVEQNFLCPLGEIDLIMREKSALVFVEVRFRRSSTFGSGAETVTPAKQRKLIRTAQTFLQRNSPHAEPDCRFDIVEAWPGEPFELHWIQDAFEA